MRKTLIAAVFLLTANATYAQTEEITPQPKRFTHHVGVQVNELFRQIFNFNGNAVNSNPYLFTYSINSVRSGWGLRTGIGYNYQSQTDDDGITRRSANLNDLHARLGFEKLFTLSPKWSAGAGVDAVVNHNDHYSKSLVRGFDSVTTVLSSKITSYGGGPMIWLRYHLTNKVLIGTESSIYYTSGQEKSDIAITRRQFNGGSQQLVTTVSKVDNERTKAKLSIPVAFFLIVRF